jgi:L-fuconate dehydratase
MPTRIVQATTYDVRFPTSRSGAGSDAMYPYPVYAGAFVALETDDPSGHTGHGLPFPSGRGTEVCVAAIEALTPLVVGATVE